MINSKLVALFVCPALIAPPVVLSVNKHARHAVARVLHRAANGLDRSRRSVPVQYAALPCVPTFAGSGGGEGLVPAGGLSSFGPLGAGTPSVADGGRSAPVGYGGGGFHSDSGGSSGGGRGGELTIVPASPTSPMTGQPVVELTPTAQGVMPVAVVAEPHTWAMLIAGFGAVGAAMRHRRLAVVSDEPVRLPRAVA